MQEEPVKHLRENSVFLFSVFAACGSYYIGIGYAAAENFLCLAVAVYAVNIKLTLAGNVCIFDIRIFPCEKTEYPQKKWERRDDGRHLRQNEKHGAESRRKSDIKEHEKQFLSLERLVMQTLYSIFRVSGALVFSIEGDTSLLDFVFPCHLRISFLSRCLK